ncbi:MAG TPA: patatin-like phospholipase family protein [Nitrososphaeraceae archaeon]|nr:patatin-like phospholipase family protein [Nitrososphaeraceae archaeon]
MKPNINRALILQGGGSLGAYEAGAYKALTEDLLAYVRSDWGENVPLFHIISGTSIGAINAALLVSYLKENKTWDGSAERLVEFWEYLSTQASVENIPYFKAYWDSWRKLDSRIASGESARRYFSTKEFILKGVPKVFVPKTPMFDNRFFDPSNTWYVYDNKPLKKSLEKFAKFPISTSYENNEPRLLLVAVDVQLAGYPVVFDSYEKEDGTRKSEYGRYGRIKFGSSEKDQQNTEGFEHIIRYNDGITSDFVLASCSVPINYDYTRLNVEERVLVEGGQGDNADTGDNNRPPSSSNANNSLRSFWDGGLLANTPLRQTILAHRDYWHQVRKAKDNIPKLRYVIINLHPDRQDYLPSDYDGVVDRKNDILFHDRTRYDENVAVLVSDFIRLAKTFIKLAEENGVSKETIQKILKEETKAVYLATGKHWRIGDLVKANVDVDFVVRLERKNDSHTISNKTFDFSKTTIQQLIQDGYQETKEQLKGVIAKLREVNREKKYFPDTG